jgi:hypothetical protein
MEIVLDISIVNRIAQPIENQLGITASPSVRSLSDEFRAVIHRNCFRYTFEPDQPIQHTTAPLACNGHMSINTKKIAAIALSTS